MAARRLGMTNPLLAVRAVTNGQGRRRLGPVTRGAVYARARRPSPCVRFGWSWYTGRGPAALLAARGAVGLDIDQIGVDAEHGGGAETGEHEHGSVKHQHRGRKNYAVRGRTPQEGLCPCLGRHPMMELPHASEPAPG